MEPNLSYCQFACGRVLYGHRPGIEHSAGSGEALAVGDAALVASVLAAGPAAAVAPVVMTVGVGCWKVFTAPLPEPAIARPVSGVALTITADAITAQPPIAASSFAFIPSCLPPGDTVAIVEIQAEKLQRDAENSRSAISRVRCRAWRREGTAPKTKPQL